MIYIDGDDKVPMTARLWYIEGLWHSKAADEPVQDAGPAAEPFLLLATLILLPCTYDPVLSLSPTGLEERKR